MLIMKCKDIQNKLIDYIENELTLEEHSIIKTHLANCSECQKCEQKLHNTFHIFQIETFKEADENYYKNFLPKVRQRIEKETTPKPFSIWRLVPTLGISILLILVTIGIIMQVKKQEQPQDNIIFYAQAEENMENINYEELGYNTPEAQDELLNLLADNNIKEDEILYELTPEPFEQTINDTTGDNLLEKFFIQDDNEVNDDELEKLDDEEIDLLMQWLELELSKYQS